MQILLYPVPLISSNLNIDQFKILIQLFYFTVFNFLHYTF